MDPSCTLLVICVKKTNQAQVERKVAEEDLSYKRLKELVQSNKAQGVALYHNSINTFRDVA